MPTARDYFIAGNFYYKNRRFRRAIKCYAAAVAIDPQYADAYYNWGLAHADLKEYREAIEQYQKAIATDSEYADAYYNRGLAHFGLKEYREAIEQYEKAIAIDSEYADAYNNWGNAHFELKEYREAIEQYEKAIAINPELAAAYYNWGLAHFGLNEYREAIEQYEKATAINPEHAAAYYNRGIAYNLLENKPQATADFYRFLYLTYESGIESFAVSQLFGYFSREVEAPYIVKKLVFGGEAYTQTIQSLLAQTQVLDTWRHYAAYLLRWPTPELTVTELKAYVRALPAPASQTQVAYLRWLVLVHYYFGDPVTAFRLCDEVLDAEDNVDGSMDLAMQYYFVRTAAEIQHPDEKAILKNALAQAEEVWESGSPAEMYYAGQLHYLNKDLPNAQKCFAQAGDFLPAQYMQLLLANETGDKATRDARIQALAQAEQAAGVFLYGFSPVTLTTDVAETLSHLYCYAQYSEVGPAIELVRHSLSVHADQLKKDAFHEVWQFELSEEQRKEQSRYFRDIRLKGIAARLQKLLADEISKIDKSQISDYFKENEKEEIRGLFDKLSGSKYRQADKLEGELGRLIGEWKYDTEVYQNLSHYFYLQNKLDLYTVFIIEFYISIKKAKANVLNAYKEEASIDVVKEFVNLITHTSPLVSVGTHIASSLNVSAGAAAFGSLTTVSIAAFLSRLYVVKRNQILEQDLKSIKYSQFKSEFMDVLDATIEEIGEEKILQSEFLPSLQAWMKETKPKIKEMFKEDEKQKKEKS